MVAWRPSVHVSQCRGPCGQAAPLGTWACACQHVSSTCDCGPCTCVGPAPVCSSPGSTLRASDDAVPSDDAAAVAAGCGDGRRWQSAYICLAVPCDYVDGIQLMLTKWRVQLRCGYKVGCSGTCRLHCQCCGMISDICMHMRSHAIIFFVYCSCAMY
jgi:hypothetical protein